MLVSIEIMSYCFDKLTSVVSWVFPRKEELQSLNVDLFKEMTLLFAIEESTLEMGVCVEREKAKQELVMLASMRLALFS